MKDSEDFYTLTTEEYAGRIADANTKIFTEALYVDPSDPDSQLSIEHSAEVNKVNLIAYQHTYDPAHNNPENIESSWGYTVLDGNGNVDLYQGSADDTDTLRITYDTIAYANADKNAADDNTKLIDGYDGRTVVSLKRVDDNWKLIDINHSPR